MKTHLHFSCYLTSAVLAALTFAPDFPLRAQQPSTNPPYATGLLPPTPAEREWMDKHLHKPKKIKLNKLGLERINEHRRAKGLAPLNVPVTADGAEIDCEGGGVGLNDVAGVTLPSAVDNSALPSFPPVRNQGSIGSCASFSTTYYTATHMVGLARGWNNKSDDNSTKFSPKWTYPMVNNGQDSGSWFTPTFIMLLQHGAATWAEWPYSGVNTPSSYREWCRDGAVWRRAIQYRLAEAGMVSSVNTESGLNDLKTLLANGYVLLYATDIHGWQFMAVSDDPATPDDNAFAGKFIAYYVMQNPSGHAMTVVGFNDNLWCDINKNGVVDAGEKGALRICNSWGTDWRPGSDYVLGPYDGGFTWLAYDALRTTSAVSGASTPLRVPGADEWRTAWWNHEAYWLRAPSACTPQLVAQFTLNHAKRAQLGVKLGYSATNATSPAQTWTPGALDYQGGNYAFDGTTTAVNGTFAFDVSDLVTNGAGRFYVSMNDNAAGSSASLSDFRLLDASGDLLAVASGGVPGSADNSTALAYANLNFAPPVILNSGSTNAQFGESFSFTINASGSPTSYGASSLPPGLTVNTNTGLISGSPAQSGTFVASLFANNASGTGTGSLAIAVGSAPVAPPGITSSSTATGTVSVAFNYTITASNSPTSFGASGLPAGLSVNTASGAISGTPTEAGNYSVQLSAANAGGTGTRALALVINPPPATVPVITSALTAEGRVGNPFTYRIIATNTPTSYGADGLPGELTVNTNTGVISGTPAVARDHAITLRARNAAGTGYATLLLSVLGDSGFGPANDAFANRTVLAGTNVFASGGNNNASPESGEPAHAGYPASRSVWWTWPAPASGIMTVSTEGSTFDTVLAIYTGATVTNLALVAADDQGGSNNTSRATFSATAGTAYQIAVDGFGGAMGTVILNVQLAATPTAPTNDLFANRLTLTGSNLTTTGRNFAATAEPSEPAHAGSPATNSVWWTWTAPIGALVSLTTMGSDFDTLLAVYTGTDVNALTPVASDDQSGGNNTSALTFTAAAGVTYQIAVDGYAGAAGNILLTLLSFPGGAPPPNDNFANRITLTGTNVTALGTNTTATAQSGEPAHADSPARKSVWWSWTAPSNSLAAINTAGSGFDTVLAVYTGTNLALLVPVASSDDADGLNTSRVSFPVTAGTTYQIAVDGYDGASGNIVLHLVGQGAAPANDNFVNAFTLNGSTPSGVGFNVNATFELEPSHAGYPPSKSVWWNWTAPTNGLMTFRTLGSDFDTVLGVYTGSSVMLLTSVASADDSDGALTSKVTFWANAGTTYRIAVDGYNGATGNILLTGTFTTGGEFLYATDFDYFPSGAAKLAGVDGWAGYNTLWGYMHGIIPGFENMGQAAYLGYYPPMGASPVSVYRPVDFQPVAAGRPVVYCMATLALVDSSNGKYDTFAVTFYNRLGFPLAAIVLNNATLQIGRYDGTATTSTGQQFENDAAYELLVTVDFATNKWSATLGALTLFTNQPFHAGAQTRDLGMVAAEWYLTNIYYPGDNFLLFDNYAIAATPVPTAPVITADPQSRTNLVGSMASFTVIASSTTPMSYQWQCNSTNLPGATNATLSLFNVALHQAGAYRVRVSNTAGTSTSQSAQLTVLPAPPIELSTPRMTSRGFQFWISAIAGSSYTVETSTNLLHWTPLASVPMDIGGSAFFMDSAATNGACRFYRVRPAGD